MAAVIAIAAAGCLITAVLAVIATGAFQRRTETPAGAHPPLRAPAGQDAAGEKP